MSTALTDVQKSFSQIPIIDLHGLKISLADRKALASEIRDACINVGFFYVKNYGIPDEIIDGVLSMSEKFFSLPLDLKMEIENRKSPNFMGYSPLLSGNNDPDNAGDMQEGFAIGYEDMDDSGNTKSNKTVVANAWPAQIPSFRETVLEYFHSVVQLGNSLFPLFALALNLPVTFFDDKTKNSIAFMRLLHYPPQTGLMDDRVVGIGAHTDYECFTILLQQRDVQALQVLNAQQQWINAPPIPGTLVINLGDFFARWTNDVFKSTVHRAINRSGVRRYSIPVFFGTDYDVKVETLPSYVSPEQPSKYETITAGEYVKARFKETYDHHFQTIQDTV